MLKKTNGNSYLIQQGHECLSACLGCVIGGSFPDITPNAIVLIGNGFEMWLDSATDVLSTRMYESNFQFIDEFHVPIVQKKASDMEEAVNILDEELQKQKVLIVKLNPLKLDYNRVFGQAENSTHYVCVLAKDGDMIYICDNYVPTREPEVYEGWIKADMLLDSWKDMEYDYYYLNSSLSFQGVEVDNIIKKRIKNGLQKYVAGGQDCGIYYGKDAVKQLFYNVVQRGINNDVQKLTDINYQLRVFGFIALRHIIFEELQRMKIMNENDSKYILTEWNNICMLMLKCGFSKREKSYTMLLEKVEYCMEREIKLYESLLEII